MSSRCVKPTEKLANKEHLPNGANVAERIAEYKCLCGKGIIEYHNTPGFDDSFFYVKCPTCSKKIKYMTWSGYDWEIYE
ncbi:MAG: hypothetical protein IJW64_05060 [Clostridia bacterium]|nr:hypothetical protein [Clostridia bacterium]